MDISDLENITTEDIFFPGWKEKDIRVSVLRLDKIHSVISGNKWFKLRFYLDEALQTNKQTIATFGGAWSNHIVATAADCKQNNIKSIGIIRGEKPTNFSNTLITAASLGMKFYFQSRQDYKEKKLPEELEASKDSIYFISEGGYGEKGASGAATIADTFNKTQFTHICCAIGTGTMMAGLIKSAMPRQEIVGISVLKNNFSQQADIKNLLTDEESEKQFTIFHEYHHGGYAKYTSELIKFMNDFYNSTTIPVDFVYTAKLFYAINDLLEKNYFRPGSRVLLIHSGGLQGNSSLTSGMLIF